ncbi:MAG: hypothetical protein JWO12_3528 [Frankiales bacterium]|nr:hypothetical protein [Frankiales bacterium]
MLLRRLALLVAAEGAALLAVGIGYGAVGVGAKEVLFIELAALTAVVTGLVLLLLARAAAKGRPWCRSPIVVLNVFPFPLALTQLQAGVWWVALPMVLLAGSVLYLLATPDLRAAFRES